MNNIIADEDFVRGTVRIQSIAEELAFILKQASKEIETLIHLDVIKLEEKKTLEQIYRKMNTSAESINEVASNLTKDTANFIAEIEEADSYLYQGKGWK